MPTFFDIFTVNDPEEREMFEQFAAHIKQDVYLYHSQGKASFQKEKPSSGLHIFLLNPYYLGYCSDTQTPEEERPRRVQEESYTVLGVPIKVLSIPTGVRGKYWQDSHRVHLFYDPWSVKDKLARLAILSSLLDEISKDLGKNCFVGSLSEITTPLLHKVANVTLNTAKSKLSADRQRAIDMIRSLEQRLYTEYSHLKDADATLFTEIDEKSAVESFERLKQFSAFRNLSVQVRVDSVYIEIHTHPLIAHLRGGDIPIGAGKFSFKLFPVSEGVDFFISEFEDEGYHHTHTSREQSVMCWGEFVSALQKAKADFDIALVFGYFLRWLDSESDMAYKHWNEAIIPLGIKIDETEFKLGNINVLDLTNEGLEENTEDE